MLGRLRERVEGGSVGGACGDEELPRAFGRRVEEDRSFDLGEAEGVEVGADGVGDLRAALESLGEARAAQVEIAVLQLEIDVGGASGGERIERE